jgi:hypothetical protein
MINKLEAKQKNQYYFQSFLFKALRSELSRLNLKTIENERLFGKADFGC